MKSSLFFLLAATVGFHSIQAANLELEWHEPENFRDAQYSYNGGERGRNIVLRDLERYFIRLGKSLIPKGTTLKMKVAELDLAGEFEPWRGAGYYDIRIVKEIYPARIHFEWMLLDAEGTVLAQGSEKLRDFSGPSSSAAMFLRNTENYPYVKSLVQNWMRRILRVRGQH